MSRRVNTPNPPLAATVEDKRKEEEEEVELDDEDNNEGPLVLLSEYFEAGEDLLDEEAKHQGETNWIKFQRIRASMRWRGQQIELVSRVSVPVSLKPSRRTACVDPSSTSWGGSGPAEAAQGPSRPISVT
jgi:hypothetical protein